MEGINIIMHRIKGSWIWVIGMVRSGSTASLGGSIPFSGMCFRRLASVFEGHIGLFKATRKQHQRINQTLCDAMN